MNDAADTGCEALDEPALIARAQRGEAAAMHALIDRYAGPLYVAAVYMTGRPGDAADLVQETLLAMVRSLPKFRGEARFKTWLWAILIRQAGRLRKQRPVGPIGPEPACPGGEAAADARMDVHAALGRLPDDQRDALVLREFEGMSYEQMARTLGVPRGTVESRLHRARLALRQCLAGYDAGDEG